MIKHWRTRLDAQKGYLKDGQYLMGTSAIQAAMEDHIRELEALCHDQQVEIDNANADSSLLAWLNNNPQIEIGRTWFDCEQLRTVHLLCDREYVLLAQEPSLHDALIAAQIKLKEIR